AGVDGINLAAGDEPSVFVVTAKERVSRHAIEAQITAACLADLLLGPREQLAADATAAEAPADRQRVQIERVVFGNLRPDDRIAPQEAESAGEFVVEEREVQFPLLDGRAVIIASVSRASARPLLDAPRVHPVGKVFEQIDIPIEIAWLGADDAKRGAVHSRNGITRRVRRM